MWNILFLCGCPRSGTTALLDFVNSDMRVALGKERYYKRCVDRFNLMPAHFEEERFFSLEKDDTFWSDLESVRSLKERFRRAVYRGDKVPRLYERLPDVFAAFPKSKVIFIIRNIVDVAASYNVRARNSKDSQWDSTQDYIAAVRDWNLSLKKYVEAREAGKKILLIEYERFFATSDALLELYEFLELDVTERIAECHKDLLLRSASIVENKKVDSLTSTEKRFVLLNADIGLYRNVVGLHGEP